MTQEWPTWSGIVIDAVTSLEDGQHDVAVAQEQLDSDRSDGRSPDIEASRQKAAQLLGAAQQHIDRAKQALAAAAALRVA